MTLEEIKQAVQEIRSKAELDKYDETIHGDEDDLRERFIRFLATTVEGEIGDMAREVIKTSDMDFERYWS